MRLYPVWTGRNKNAIDERCRAKVYNRCLARKLECGLSQTEVVRASKHDISLREDCMWFVVFGNKLPDANAMFVLCLYE